MSWLAPLVNNRVGELLRVQLRHEHLFFMKDGLVVDEIGYGEDGRRFHERDMGKPMHTPADLTANGYWFIAPKLNAKAASEAVSAAPDGAYYSVFSNQCQDWAHRVRRKAMAIQRQQRLPIPEPCETDAKLSKPVKATVPAVWYLGMIAVLIGLFGFMAPATTGLVYIKFVALLLAAIGISDVIYAFSSKSWETLLATLALGGLSLLGAAALWANSYFLMVRSNGLLAVILAVAGISRIVIALRSRPISAWLGTLGTGILLLVTAAFAWNQRDGAAGAWMLGVSLSVSFVAAGISTIWLNWKLQRA